VANWIASVGDCENAPNRDPIRIECMQLIILAYRLFLGGVTSGAKHDSTRIQSYRTNSILYLLLDRGHGWARFHIETTQTYLHAHLALKEVALAKLKPYERGKRIRFQPNDRLLAFLEALGVVRLLIPREIAQHSDFKSPTIPR
jgi:hypothetical protein